MLQSIFFWYSVAEVLNQLNQSPNQRALLRNQRSLANSSTGSGGGGGGGSPVASSALNLFNAINENNPGSQNTNHKSGEHAQNYSNLNGDYQAGQHFGSSNVEYNTGYSSTNDHYNAAAAAAAAAVYSQLDANHSFNYGGYGTSSGGPHHQAKTSQRHNPYSRNSTPTSVGSSAPALNNSSLMQSDNASVNATAAAILSSLGSGYSNAAAAAAVAAGNSSTAASNYSAALYYHPYYSAHHYLHHPNVVSNLNQNSTN